MDPVRILPELPDKKQTRKIMKNKHKNTQTFTHKGAGAITPQHNEGIWGKFGFYPLTSQTSFIIFRHFQFLNKEMMMPNSKNSFETLRDIRDTMIQEKRELEDDILSIERIIERKSKWYKGEGEIVVKAPSPLENSHPGPNAAIKALFDSYPSKKWKPTQLRDELQKMVNAGSVQSDASNLLHSVHSALRPLIANNYVTKFGTNRKSISYQKSSDDRLL